MTQTPKRSTSRPRLRDLAVAIGCAVAVAGMTGLAFASVPLYDIFCRVTGFGGTPRLETASSIEGVPVLDREITVRFDANTMPGLPWAFEADQQTVKVRIGELRTITYRARNLSREPTVGVARFNVSPDTAASYFSKIACFCETDQRLEPGQEVEMGVTFYVDPAIVDDDDTKSLKSITLSYSFFESKKAEKPVAAAPAAAPNPS